MRRVAGTGKIACMSVSGEQTAVEERVAGSEAASAAGNEAASAAGSEAASTAGWERLESRSRVIGWTGFLFILLQSICAAVLSLTGLRFLIGVGALAMAAGLVRTAGSFHADAIRIPMMVVAVAGAAVNLFVVRRIRTLRAKPASQWRMRPATAKQLRSETTQVVLAYLTLVLVVMEWVLHRILHGAG